MPRMSSAAVPEPCSVLTCSRSLLSGCTWWAAAAPAVFSEKQTLNCLHEEQIPRCRIAVVCHIFAYPPLHGLRAIGSQDRTACCRAAALWAAACASWLVYKLVRAPLASNFPSRVDRRARLLRSRASTGLVKIKSV